MIVINLQLPAIVINCNLVIAWWLISLLFMWQLQLQCRYWDMRVKEAASIVVNMPKKKHKNAKKNHVVTDSSGWLMFISFYMASVFYYVL